MCALWAGEKGSATGVITTIFPNLRAGAIAVAVCVIAPCVLLGLQIGSNSEFSPFDEAAHLDYVERVSRGELPRQGEKMLESTMREISCNGYQELDVSHLPDCDTPGGRWPEEMKWNQHEAQQPPTYYVATAPLRWASHNVLGVRGDLQATRVTSIAWTIIGLILLWFAGRLMAIPPLVLGGVLLVLVSSPWLVYLNATVSNDVTALPAAGLVALVGALVYRWPGRVHPGWLLAAGFLASALKTTNIFATAAVAGLLLIWELRKGGRKGRTAAVRAWAGTGGLLLIGGVAATLIWTGIHNTTALIDVRDDPALDGLRQGPRDLGTVLASLSALLWPLVGDPAAAVVRHLSPDILGAPVLRPLHALLAAAPIAVGLSALFVSPRRWPNVLGLLSMGLLVIGALVMAVGFIILYDQDPDPSPRYGISLAPMFALALGAAVVGRWGRGAVVAFAAVLFAATVGALLAH